ncbi:MAG: GGDEF domain-containing protein [Piscirickettsiaceae bacterium]|nr:MAG: GGDEF domain-containing protein [Piscirickettsiaceae bacterium]
MTDYKEKYQKAIKALDESEQEAVDNIRGLYKTLLGILRAVKGRHKLIDDAVAKLPKKIVYDRLPIVDLECVKDLIVSHLDKGDEVVSSLDVLDELLSKLSVSDGLHDDVLMLQESLSDASSSKDFLGIAQKIASVVLQSGGSNVIEIASSGQSIEDIKEGLFLQLNQLELSDSEISRSLDIAGLKEKLNEVESLRDLETFYKHVFEGLGRRLNKKNEFIAELSGLIETIVQQLSDLSLDIKSENAKEGLSSKDRWRITETMGKEVTSIREGVLRAESLASLKDMLAERINSLNSNVNELMSIESSRVKEAEENTKKISKKLHKVEVKVSSLKASLNKAHEQAFTDQLTGVANRRAYDQRIKVEYERLKRSKGSLIIAIIDIDHFKRINDNYGHPAGDKVLKTVSQLINKQVRESDFFGRVGGEEFTVIFVESDIENALKRLNDFRERVQGCKFGIKGQRVIITVSAGCAKFEADDDPDSVYARADRALYQAKQTGRNKCLSEPAG